MSGHLSHGWVDPFNSRPFAAGSLTGLRTFDVDPDDGRLRGPFFPAVFEPGENHAACYTTLPAVPRYTADGRIRMGRELVLSRQSSLPTHVVGGRGCRCGFYAYTDGSNDQYHPYRTDQVEAIIEGYGICTIGNRGFKASKARLVALIDPRPAPWWLWSAFTVTVGLAVVGLVGAVTGAAARNFAVAAPMAVTAGAYAWYTTRLRRWARTRRAKFARTTAHYPGVPVYRSVEAATKAHPLSVRTSEREEDL